MIADIFFCLHLTPPVRANEFGMQKIYYLGVVMYALNLCEPLLGSDAAAAIAFRSRNMSLSMVTCRHSVVSYSFSGSDEVLMM